MLPDTKIVRLSDVTYTIPPETPDTSDAFYRDPVKRAKAAKLQRQSSNSKRLAHGFDSQLKISGASERVNCTDG